MHIPFKPNGEEGWTFTRTSAEGSCGDSTYTLYYNGVKMSQQNFYNEPDTLDEAIAEAIRAYQNWSDSNNNSE